jgi:low affinity Fe/Cu permease
MHRSGLFGRFARSVARATGHPYGFVSAALIIVVWAATGPAFGFSDSWQLLVNTGTTVITYLMVFLIQNTQNRDSEAMQIKLDELIRATEGCHNALLDLEELDEGDIRRIRRLYEKLADEARKDLRRGRDDTSTSAVDLTESAKRTKSASSKQRDSAE